MSQSQDVDEKAAVPLLFAFFNEIGIIDQLVTTQLERALPDGLKSAQFGVLNHFARLGGEQTPAELASAFQVTKGAMTNTLSRLETKGLVRIRIHPNDGRSKLVSMSAKGRRTRDSALRAIAPAFAEFESQFPMAKIKKVLPTLHSVRTFLDQARS